MEGAGLYSTLYSTLYYYCSLLYSLLYSFLLLFTLDYYALETDEHVRKVVPTALYVESQKRPTIVSKETYYSVKRDLL